MTWTFCFFLAIFILLSSNNNDEEYPNPIAISIIFNHYFSNVVNNLNNDLPDNDVNHLDYLINNVVCSLFFLQIR